MRSKLARLCLAPSSLETPGIPGGGEDIGLGILGMGLLTAGRIGSNGMSYQQRGKGKRERKRTTGEISNQKALRRKKLSATEVNKHSLYC